MDPNAWLASQMPKENLGDFNEPWCWKIIGSPMVKEVPFQSRTITRNSTMHSLFNRTLATNDTLRAAQAFLLKDGESEQALLLASLGTGLDGHAGLAHGGTISTLFDESLSLAALTQLESEFLTAETTISYKAPISTPCLVLVRSWVAKHDGRKVWIEGTMEDGNGLIYARAHCLFITKRKSKA